MNASSPTGHRLALHADASQRQTLSPRLQHAVRLLQLSSMEFTQELQTLQGRNPFLDFEDEDGPSAGSAESMSADDGGSGGLDDDREPWLGEPARATRQHESGDASALDFVPNVRSLAEHLHFQLSLLRLSQRDLALAHAIVDSLDDDGYLRMELAELLSIFAPGEGIDGVTEDELLIALRRVQSLEPLGVGARDLKECLGLQLVNIACPHERALAAAVIETELEPLAKHQWASMARRLACSSEALDAAVRRIRQMDPRPGWRHGAAQTRYITPDVIVRKKRGRWVATLNGNVVPKVSLNKGYADMLQQQGGAAGTELSSHLQEARWTMRNIEQRFSTIESVAQAIVDRQAHFLDYGPMAMKPMGLREIAEALGMHESTVSRVTSNKYMATPAGVFELKHFFSRAHVNSNGSACSPTAIRGLVQRMLESEQAGVAQSDAEIARRLRAQGLDVARRTVTKYRQMLRIEPCDQRRKAAAASLAS
ncbi:RNA polymerase factor sigma-54 [Paucibacter sp. R3-3]|uniref:RNA polymerase sigma-54 factor n=1 Tax=Roseateles agri TaxID=3098619 RepID=A0ABU5DGE3_9BURK|nr:RNA polymerase factor sigma-54 [Paucibacter sp. R3-3]MDY0745354.1 RNA polymerase factor sigma-54 [Paucibacter sp. R3-3]